MAESSTTDRLLDAAERRLRTAGYNGFSFRDLAQDVGIKSASVHHHFPTKEALVTRLAERYGAAFMAGLADAPEGERRIEAYRRAFRGSIEDGFQMCLCGVLGAESLALPETVRAQNRRSLERLARHLADGLAGTTDDPEGRALAVLATLEGALILARAFGDVAVFDRATATLSAG